MNDAVTSALAGIFFTLFYALDQQAQHNAAEILWRISDDPKAEPGEAKIYRSLLDVIESSYDPHYDFRDQLSAATPLSFIDDMLANTEPSKSVH